MVIDAHQGSRYQSAPTSMAKRAARIPRPTGVIQAGVFFSVKSHPPNQRMQSGIVTKVVPNTLMVLPMKVAREACKPNEARIGLRKRISSITIGNSPRITRRAVFQFGGPLPVIGLIGHSTVHEVYT